MSTTAECESVCRYTLDKDDVTFVKEEDKNKRTCKSLFMKAMIENIQHFNSMVGNKKIKCYKLDVTSRRRTRITVSMTRGYSGFIYVVVGVVLVMIGPNYEYYLTGVFQYLNPGSAHVNTGCFAVEIFGVMDLDCFY